MIKLSKRRSPGRQKSMCFAAKGRLQGRAAKLLLVRRKSWYNENLAAICLAANGPAIWGGCVTRREHRAESWYFSQKTVTVQGGYGARFCRPGTNFIEHYACRGTSLIGAAKLSPVTNLVTGTGAVSRYKLSRSQKFVKVQDFNCVQMSVSGCNDHYKFVLGAGAKAKSVTNNLPILSVLCVAFLFNY